LTLTGTGDTNGTGNTLNNTIIGNSGNNVLQGLAGNDTLNGGTGDDTYVFASGFGNDSILDSSGSDTLDFSAFTSALNINLSLTSFNQSTGNSVSWSGSVIENLTGGSGNDTLRGNSSNNLLDGGSGSNTLIGGTGNDTYSVHSSSDVVTENAGEGTDTVDSYANYTLAANVENLVLMGDSLSGTGNSGANTLTGDIGNDTLNGGGGNDLLDGSLGNDTYVYTTGWGSDTISDAGGNDTLDLSANNSTMQINLTATTADHTNSVSSDIFWTGEIIENIIKGIGDDVLTGTSANNSLSAGAGNDSVNGGAGNDSLIGGKGNDTLKGGTGNDTYFFSLGDGVDSVQEADSTAGNSDTLSFDASVIKANIALFMSGNNLQIGYKNSTTDQITVVNQQLASGSIERLQASDGTFLTNADVNSVIQAMSSYATSHSVSFTSLSNVENNSNLLSIVSSAWHH
jgi:Ca2+-binding RTX toxin-like protein